MNVRERKIRAIMLTTGCSKFTAEKCLDRINGEDIEMNDYKRELKVIGVDLDGLLCNGDSFTPEECLGAKPLKKNIDMVNEIQQYNFVVIFTARRDNLIEATLKWLKRNGVLYQAISNQKTPCDIYIDDRAESLKKVYEELKKGIEHIQGEWR